LLRYIHLTPHASNELSHAGSDGRRPGIAGVRMDGRQPRTERPSARAAESARGLSWGAEALERSPAHRGWALGWASSAWIDGGRGAVAGCRRSRRAAHGIWGGRVQVAATGPGRRHDRVGALSFAGCGAVAVPGRWHMQRWLCCMRNLGECVWISSASG